jgi:DNA-binding NarL/FixJ family response regulator
MEMNALKKITVTLADDHAIFRQGLRALLEAERDIEVIGEASNGREAIELVMEKAPDVVVMDITMPDITGIQAADIIKTRLSAAKIIILSMYGDEEYVDQAIQSGVDAYLVKDTVAGELIKAIREVVKGNAFFSPSVSTILRDRQKRQLEHDNPGELTLREKEVLQFVTAGKTSREIGEILNISPRTVDKHRQQVMDKLDVRDIAGLTRYALGKGLIK